MELKELLKWVNGHLRLRNSPEIQNFTRDWVDGKAYLSIIYNVSIARGEITHHPPSIDPI